MRVEAILILIVAIFWGSWPLVARSSGTGGPMGSLILSIAGLVPIAAAIVLQGDAATWPSPSSLGRLLVAGAMMGIGLVAFNMVANSEIEASVSIPVIDSAMLVVSAVGAIYFFGESVTAQKVVGITLLLSGIAVLRPS